MKTEILFIKSSNLVIGIIQFKKNISMSCCGVFKLK